MQNSDLETLLIQLLICVTKQFIDTVINLNWLEGKPGLKDEPQHITQGKKIRNTLKSYGIKFLTQKR